MRIKNPKKKRIKVTESLLKELIDRFENLKQKQGVTAFSKLSELLDYVKEKHRKNFKGKDFEQSWKPVKGRLLERFIMYAIKSEVEALGLKAIMQKDIESEKLTEELEQVRTNVLVHYGEGHSLVPDADIIIYDPSDRTVLAIISSKVTLRERIAQTAYWKLKLANGHRTKNIRAFFVTPDEDEVLVSRLPTLPDGAKGYRSRIIVEFDTDGAYVLRSIEESHKVKSFSKLVEDLKRIINEKRNSVSKR